jgi:hypothetical protein
LILGNFTKTVALQEYDPIAKRTKATEQTTCISCYNDFKAGAWITRCEFCDVVSCRKCIKRYLEEQHHIMCMGCKKEWTYEGISGNLGISYTAKYFTNNVMPEVIKIEKAFVAESSALLPTKRKLDECEAELDAVKNDMKEVRAPVIAYILIDLILINFYCDAYSYMLSCGSKKHRRRIVSIKLMAMSTSLNPVLTSQPSRCIALHANLAICISIKQLRTSPYVQRATRVLVSTATQ